MLQPINLQQIALFQLVAKSFVFVLIALININNYLSLIIAIDTSRSPLARKCFTLESIGHSLLVLGDKVSSSLEIPTELRIVRGQTFVQTSNCLHPFI